MSRPETKVRQAVSEDLFEEFCRLNELACVRIEEEEEPRPDYKVRLSNGASSSRSSSSIRMTRRRNRIDAWRVAAEAALRPRPGSHPEGDSIRCAATPRALAR